MLSELGWGLFGRLPAGSSRFGSPLGWDWSSPEATQEGFSRLCKLLASHAPVER